MKLVITGAYGFIGKNLRVHLAEAGYTNIVCIGHADTGDALRSAIDDADFIFHLAGVNRPENPADFSTGNCELTIQLTAMLTANGGQIPVAYTSSIQAELDNPYGISKKAAEDALLAYSRQTGAPVYLYRLPNVFGKWSRPFYNSVVATFCHQIARNETITVNKADVPLQLTYIDDVCEQMLELLSSEAQSGFQTLATAYNTTVGELAQQIKAFKESRETLITEPVGTGLVRALYATYISFLPTEDFSYAVPSHGDARGVFVEMLKTRDSGQFSFFTAHPGITRGGHYHHAKTEKFLVISGEARFRFKHIVTGEERELVTSGKQPQIVETIPGWAHDVTNVGEHEMVVMLWANEIFDRAHPDTYAHKV